MSKKCCFIGHRNVQATEELIKRIDDCLQSLIDDGVRIFLFGSKSKFDTLCHERVTEMRKRYPDIKRIAYTCKSEYAVKRKEKDELERIAKRVTKREIRLKDYDGEKQSKRLERAGKASYVERNEDMINESEYCVFFYDPVYLPPKRKERKGGSEYQPSSGTALAYEYADKRKKSGGNLQIINLAEEKF